MVFSRAPRRAMLGTIAFLAVLGGATLTATTRAQPTDTEAKELNALVAPGAGPIGRGGPGGMQYLRYDTSATFAQVCAFYAGKLDVPADQGFGPGVWSRAITHGDTQVSAGVISTSRADTNQVQFYQVRGTSTLTVTVSQAKAETRPTVLVLLVAPRK